MYVFDATPLIYLATVERLALLSDLPVRCVVPERVYEEVVTVGLEQGHTDARRIERAVDKQILNRRSEPGSAMFERLRGNDSLSDADAAVLAMTADIGGTAVMDEQYGRAVATAEGIETRGTAYLLLRLLQEGRLPAEETRSVVDAMMDAGWYCTPNLYARLLRKIEEHE